VRVMAVVSLVSPSAVMASRQDQWQIIHCAPAPGPPRIPPQKIRML